MLRKISIIWHKLTVDRLLIFLYLCSLRAVLPQVSFGSREVRGVGRQHHLGLFAGSCAANAEGMVQGRRQTLTVKRRQRANISFE